MSEWVKSDRRAWLEAFIVSLAVLSIPLSIIVLLVPLDIPIIAASILFEVYFASVIAESFFKDYFKAKFKKCPFINNCPQAVTEKYFEKYCNSREYIFCSYFPKPKPKPPLRQTPSRWLHVKNLNGGEEKK